MKRFVALTMFAASLVLGCSKAKLPTQNNTPAAKIVDAVHNEGNTHFFFLPPMVPQPNPTGIFDDTLRPQVQICIWEGNEEGPEICSYTMDAGMGSEVIRLDSASEQYVVNWHTDEVLAKHPLSLGYTYRIRVLVGPCELGFADVAIVSSGRELKNIQTNEFVPLLDGRTLPIKFRIEQGAIPAGPVSFSAGGHHNFAINSKGEAFAWGANSYGELGIGTQTARENLPVRLQGEVIFSQIEAGSWHSCGISKEGKLYSWGLNSYARLGNGTSGVPLTVTSPAPVASSLTFKLVHSGAVTNAALTTDGKLYCWGYNVHGAVGIPEDPSISNLHIATPVAVRPDLTFQTVAAGGGQHMAAITTEGKLYVWGYNAYGQVGNGTRTWGTSGPVLIRPDLTFKLVKTGFYHTIAVTTDNVTYVWGSNQYGELGLGSIGGSIAEPHVLPLSIDCKDIDTQWLTTYALAADGTIYGWGWNYWGELGNGAYDYTATTPVLCAAGQTFTAIEAGNDHVIALTNTGELFSWGRNLEGQAGIGSSNDKVLSPTYVIDLTPSF